MTPPQAYSALFGQYGHGPRAASSRDCMEENVGLEEVFCDRGRTVVGDFDEDSSCESDILTGLDDKLWLLHEFHVLPPGVARNGLE